MEEHAYDTCSKYLKVNPRDDKIAKSAQNEIEHINQLKEAIALIQQNVSL